MEWRDGHFAWCQNACLRRESEEVGTTTEQAVAEIRSLVYKMAERYGAKDPDGVMDTFVGEGSSIIGTEIDELRFGAEQVRLQIVRDLSEADALSFGIDRLHVDVFGDSAFAFADGRIVAGIGEETFRFPVRSTFGLTRTNDGWRIAQIHTSVAHVGQSEGRSFPVNLTKTLSDLLTSLDSEAGASLVKAKGLGTSTFVFTDIVDSTELSQSMGDERWFEVMTEHFDASVVKTLGDGGMYVFSSGTSALLAAMETQRTVAASSDPRLSIRVGVHTGDVVQGSDDFIGLTVNKAARVAAAAQGDEILASLTTADIVSNPEIRLGEPKTVELKGIAGSHVLLPVLWGDD